MIEDVELAVKCNIPVEHFGRLGGIVPDPDEVIDALKEKSLTSKKLMGNIDQIRTVLNVIFMIGAAASFILYFHWEKTKLSSFMYAAHRCS